ncbi:MAG: hypothetical protein JO202_01675 [Ktedonobacteraceae bacterium]|nr:hypothetical protein [Ktedonobacteraceae bacterium]
METMTRKQALALLHTLYEAYIETLPYEVFNTDAQQAFRHQVHCAFFILDAAIHKKPVSLCQVCYLRCASHFACVQREPLSLWRNCCRLCLEQLQAQQKMEGPPEERLHTSRSARLLTDPPV